MFHHFFITVQHKKSTVLILFQSQAVVVITAQSEHRRYRIRYPRAKEGKNTSSPHKDGNRSAEYKVLHHISKLWKLSGAHLTKTVTGSVFEQPSLRMWHVHVLFKSLSVSGAVSVTELPLPQLSDCSGSAPCELSDQLSAGGPHDSDFTHKVSLRRVKVWAGWRFFFFFSTFTFQQRVSQTADGELSSPPAAWWLNHFVGKVYFSFASRGKIKTLLEFFFNVTFLTISGQSDSCKRLNEWLSLCLFLSLAFFLLWE